VRRLIGDWKYKGEGRSAIDIGEAGEANDTSDRAFLGNHHSLTFS